jgi:hypothetical protein
LIPTAEGAQHEQIQTRQPHPADAQRHVLRSAPKREALPFRLRVERGASKTLFGIELGSERHTLTLNNEKKMHLKLADFIEEIANGPFDSTNTTNLVHPLHASREYGRFGIQDRQRVFERVITGGTLSLDMGFELPLHVAIHRTHTRAGATAILSIGIKSPRTKCFTVCGSDAEIYSKVVESINHLAMAATPAAHAA